MTACDQAGRQHSELLAQVRSEALLMVSRGGSVGTYLDVIARRLYGVEAYQHCTIAQLEDILLRVTTRAKEQA